MLVAVRSAGLYLATTPAAVKHHALYGKRNIYGARDVLVCPFLQVKPAGYPRDFGHVKVRLRLPCRNICKRPILAFTRHSKCGQVLMDNEYGMA